VVDHTHDHFSLLPHRQIGGIALRLSVRPQDVEL
jgi:hypothetical protein